MRKIIKAITALVLAGAIVYSAGCTKDSGNDGSDGENEGGGTQQGLYVGIIGFNDVLKTKSISLLNSSTESSFTNFINGLSMDDNTALYYADNTALDWLQSTTFPSDLINVSLLTFTDGLDNASLMLNSNYSTQNEFLNAINNRILNDKVQGKSINAYSIGLKGNNVTNEEDFRQKLMKLASSDSSFYLAENMDIVIQRFREIANQLYKETSIVNTNVKIPGGYDNSTTIRLTFDNVNNANNSTRYIEAVFSRENGKGKLSDIKYIGLRSESGSNIVSYSTEGASYWYTFSDLKTISEQPIDNLENMKLWIFTSSGWRPEDEFTPSSYTNTSVTRKSAVAVLVLDCTTSLGAADFRKMQDAATEFIRTLNANSSGGNEGGGSTPSYFVFVSANPSSGGIVTGGNNMYQEGEQCSVTAIANSGYRFLRWTENGHKLSTSSNYTFSVTSDRNLIAWFQDNNVLLDYTNLVLNELNGNDKFIEIFNAGSEPINMEGVYIEKDGMLNWDGDNTIIVDPGEYLVLWSEDVAIDHPEVPDSRIFHSGLSAKKNVRIQLFTPAGVSIDDFNLTNIDANDPAYIPAPASYSRNADGKWYYAYATPGAVNVQGTVAVLGLEGQ
jgi:hypothetical protein